MSLNLSLCLFCCLFTQTLIILSHLPFFSSSISPPSLHPSSSSLFRVAELPLIFLTEARCRDKNTPCCTLICFFPLVVSDSTSGNKHLLTPDLHVFLLLSAAPPHSMGFIKACSVTAKQNCLKYFLTAVPVTNTTSLFEGQKYL